MAYGKMQKNSYIQTSRFYCYTDHEKISQEIFSHQEIRNLFNKKSVFVFIFTGFRVCKKEGSHQVFAKVNDIDILDFIQ